MGYGISPGVAPPRRPHARHRLDPPRERRAQHHDCPGDRLRPAAAGDQQDRDQRADPRPGRTRVFGSGIENLKLYFMIGLPTEDRRRPGRHPRPDAGDPRPHASPRPPARRHRAYRREREPAGPQAGHRVPVDADGAAAVTERKMKRLRQLVSGLDNVYFNDQVRAALVLPGAAVARRPPRRRRRRGRRAERRQLARGGGGGRRRSRPLRLPRPPRGPVLPWDVIEGGMKHVVLPRGIRPRAPRRVDPRYSAIATCSSCSAYACRMRSRTGPALPHRRSAGGARSCGARR